MECRWDPLLLQRSDLPPELLDCIRHEDDKQYLQAISKASLDARYTYILLAHCEDLFAHICASLRAFGSFSTVIATLGRVVPHAPYLAPYATWLLQNETYSFQKSSGVDEDLSYLLGLFRLLRSNPRIYRQYVTLTDLRPLLHSQSRPVAYLAIRIFQICLNAADFWFERTLRECLGEDTPIADINGQWDEKIIDYRFLTLWEEERFKEVQQTVKAVRVVICQQLPAKRTIALRHFHESTAFFGGILLPRTINSDSVQKTHHNDFVFTLTGRENLARLASAFKLAQPILLSGLAGSGKTQLIRYAAQALGKLEKLVTLHLNEQSDAKLLIGMYTTGDVPGSFIWKPGVLTTAMQEGRWVLIEDLDRTPNEIVGTLLPLIERQSLYIPSRKETIYAAEGFRLLGTVRSAMNVHGEETEPLAHMLGSRHWHKVSVRSNSMAELVQIAQHLHPLLSPLIPQLGAVFDRLHLRKQRKISAGQTQIGMSRYVGARDLLKWCRRIANLMHQRSAFTSADFDNIFMEGVDCLAGPLPDNAVRSEITAVIAEELRIDPQRRDFLLKERDVRFEATKTHVIVGRYSIARLQTQASRNMNESAFSTNAHTTRMLERVAAAITNREPLLLVGETGVGKTTAVQYLAKILGRKVEAFNLSQQSEAGDLFGGFKPVTARSLVVPMKDEFDRLFHASFSATKNQQYLELLKTQTARSNWRAVCKLWRQALKMVDQQRRTLPKSHGEAPSKKRRLESRRTVDFDGWDVFASQLDDIEHRLSTVEAGFAFSFVEGNIVKAVRNGDWVLLDEINLASPDTLEALADLLDSDTPSLLLTEAGNIERIQAHRDFRIFAAMNPATDVGKKDLPPGIRSRFTELYVESPDKDLKSLQSIVRSYLGADATSDPSLALDVSTLYQQITTLTAQNKLADGAAQKPHFSLRTLTRTLSYARYIAPQCNMRRALFEGFQMSFLTLLDAESAGLLQPLLEQSLLGRRANTRAEIQKPLRKPDDGRRYVQGFPGSKHWLRQGRNELEEESHYILTPFIRTNLENLVRATSTRQFPVLIQGPTSSGKTSMIEYLAKRTGHKFVRINNHEHTDLQEYLGTYVSGIDGSLHFQEGILVRAIREGHWIVLDELNLAPTDVLEALNRLLDDNRELLIPETQETVRPHEDFMLFATQNPAGLYGGRKALSRAFRNRFLELHFDDIPVDELQEILHRRTQLPESRCRRIVNVYKELSVLRQENRLFEQKSFATLRDLFRWALRPNDTIEQLAANGFMLLAERTRQPKERLAIKSVVEKVLSSNGPRVMIDENQLYAFENIEMQSSVRHSISAGVVWTKAMRRLFTLVSRAIANNEPVLLVGETGSGKTTVCQLLAEAFGKTLHTVNAHQNTETGDLIGSQRPVRNRAAIEASLRQCLLDMQILKSVDRTMSTDALLDAYDDILSLMGPQEKQSHCASQAHVEIQTLRIRFKALFEWADGSLVEAMREGAFFLLDEISLADDSVLERINSVLEPRRSILLAEKGSLDTFITAAPGFQFFATMNPGGDYGKRELSPALRNRFTEIWVPSLSDTEDIMQIVSAKLVAPVLKYANAIVAFAQWFKTRFDTSASTSVSVRDALAWVRFANSFAEIDPAAAVVHGAAVVYIDTLGANPAGLMSLTGATLAEERQACLTELSRLLAVDAHAIYGETIALKITDASISFGPFSVPRRRESVITNAGFTFDAPTTRKNAMRVVRAMQINKPVMLEGSPGVGKTALITAIASAAHAPLTRINLSEQTDLLDLFGSDVPLEDASTGLFAWRDAPFLRAMKLGDWVLLDEMNLASQSVLEGLNACLDHRGEVYIPELGQTFTKHANFRLFAAQNPHHQGGGRKGLPASFVNRFTVVYADSFAAEDLLLICHQRYAKLDDVLIERAVRFVSSLDTAVVQHHRFGANGGPWEFNLRDITRWLSLQAAEHGLLKAGTTRDFVRFLFGLRFRSATDRAAVEDLFQAVFTDKPTATDPNSSMSTQWLQLGLGLLPRDRFNAETIPSATRLTWSREQLGVLQSVMIAVQQRWPLLLTGPSGCGKTTLIETLAGVVGASVTTVSLSADTDAMDLIGAYEQTNSFSDRSRITRNLQISVVKTLLSQPVAGGSEDILRVADLFKRPLVLQNADAEWARSILVAHGTSTDEKLLGLDVQPAEQAHFRWIDGPLVDALREGKWLVLDNANLCSSSVLDRLNSLLEPDGVLIISEHSEADGSPLVIRPHPDFRIFLTTDPRYGELSRAMRNRAVELFMPSANSAQLMAEPLTSESAIARFRGFRAYRPLLDTDDSNQRSVDLIEDHLGTSDLALAPRYEMQLRSGLSEQTVTCSFNKAVSNSPCLGHIAEFHNSATVTCLLATADFARVQTLHPLNNQALVTQQHSLLQVAALLGSLYDATVAAFPLLERLRIAGAEKVLVRQLTLAERAAGNVADISSVSSKLLKLIEGGIMRPIQIILESLNESARVGDTPSASLASAIADFLPAARRSRSLLHSCVDILTRSLVPVAQNTALFSAWTLMLRQAALTDFEAWLAIIESAPIGVHTGRRSIASEIDTTFSLLDHPVCTTLWRALRPLTPASLQGFQELTQFEDVVARFDMRARLFDISILDLAQTRTTLARTLRMIPGNAAKTAELQTQIEPLLALEDSTSPIGSVPVTPHFSAAFEWLSRKSAMSAMADLDLANHSNVAAVEMLALRPTNSSIASVSLVTKGLTFQSDALLLAAAVANNTELDVNNMPNDLFFLVLGQAQTFGQVSLRSLDLAKQEVEILGATISRSADVLCSDDVLSLDRCLKRMVSAVISSLAKIPELGQERALATGLLQVLEMDMGDAIQDAAKSESNLIRETVATRDLDSPWTLIREVVEYMIGASQREVLSPTASKAQAGRAWLAYGKACLQLYVPKQVFDPALRPFIERNVYRHCRADLEEKLSLLQRFSALMSGESQSLRARFVAHDIARLGPEPVTDNVFRPEASQSDELQADFVRLMSIVDSISGEQANAVGLRNLVLLRSRLQQRYPAYADFVAPVIGFIDSLLIGRQLCDQILSAGDRPSSITLMHVTPFVCASIRSWLSDESFIKAVSETRRLQDLLVALDLLALRGSIMPLRKSSTELLNVVNERLTLFYDQWKTQLDSDQRQAAAKSSLYRYRGEPQASDEVSLEDLEELFPGATETVSPSTHSTKNVRKLQDLAPDLCRLHRLLFSSKESEPRDVLDILDNFGKLCIEEGGMPNFTLRQSMPTLIGTISRLAATVFGSSERMSQSYYFYADPNLVEVKRVSQLIRQVQLRFRTLNSAWPEHATPLDVLQLCERILDLAHSEPLSNYLPHLEKLHATIVQWQSIASKEYSAAELMDEITNLIISWRKLELASWAGLLEREDHACQTNASAWWYVAYESIITGAQTVLFQGSQELEHHLNSLLRVLDNFMSSCGLGEFRPRLAMLRAFEAQISALMASESYVSPLYQALSNFLTFYRRFERPVAAAIAEGRSALEKEIKGIIQIASWKDRNIEVLRQSAKSSHNRLLRLVRKYRNLLAQPAAPFLKADDAVIAQPTSQPTVLQSTPLPRLSAEDELPYQAWQLRPARFHNIESTVAVMDAKTPWIPTLSRASEKLNRVTSELLQDIVELQRKTPSVLTDENRALVQQLKTQKRRLLADVLKGVRGMGFQINLSEDVLARQASWHTILARAPAFSYFCFADSAASAEHAFHHLLDLMPSVREGARKHSDDLTSNEASRCMMLLESLLYTCVAQRSMLVKHSHLRSELDVALRQLRGFAACQGPYKQGNAGSPTRTGVPLKFASMMIEGAVRIIQNQADLAKRDLSPVIRDLRQVGEKLVSLQADAEALPILPQGIGCEEAKHLQLQIKQIDLELSATVHKHLQREPQLGPVLLELVKWTSSEARDHGSTNGYSGIEPEQWVTDMLAAMDSLLRATERLEEAYSQTETILDHNAWVVQADQAFIRLLDAAQIEQAVASFSNALAKLQHVDSSIPNCLSHLADICSFVWPLIQSYYMKFDQILEQGWKFQNSTVRLACQLGSSFLELSQRGFCAPPEKARDDKQQAGTIESGTGLGEGEGGEDISKDIGDKEDLSELAQEGGEKGKSEDMSDVKDAVDMADEEMEGEIDADGNSSGVEDAENDRDTEDNAEMEEEIGPVDERDSDAVDEKVWDEGRTEDKNTKESDKAGANTAKAELTAGAQGESAEDQPGSATEEADIERPPDEEEQLSKQPEASDLDAHVPEQSNLSLPDDVAMDERADVQDLSDSDDLSEGLDELTSDDGQAEAPVDGPSPVEDADSSPDQDANLNLEDTGSADHDSGDAEISQEQEQDTEICMMDDRELHSNSIDQDVFGETGTGPEQDATDDKGVSGEAVTEQESAPNNNLQESREINAGASGAERGKNQRNPSEGQEQAAEENSKPAFAKLGEVLEEWYRQHNPIRTGQEDNDANRNAEFDMADAEFEHLVDDDTVPDTQALGAASAEDARALDEEKGLSVNEQDNHEWPMDAQLPDQEPIPDDEDAEPAPPVDTVGAAQQTLTSNAFIGVPRGSHQDLEMDIDQTAGEEGHVDEVDEQLTRTHLDQQPSFDSLSDDEARKLWAQHEGNVHNLALLLTEHLRLVLQPTRATKMRGDFRTGKRLNIKRIIPYIASSYKRDKIWMRRSVPTKRSYQVMLAIDDSKSMDESDSRALAFDTVALVGKALSMLEVGELSVVSFGEGVAVAHEFGMPFTAEAGAQTFKHFTFSESKTDVRKLLTETLAMFRSARLKASGSASDLWQLQLIISDGVCEDHPAIRQLVRQSHEERVLIVFVIVDSVNTELTVTKDNKQSILDLQTAEFTKDVNGEMQLKMVKYLDTFPFRYYLIVRDVRELPEVLASALRQWFAEVAETSSG